MQQKLASLGYKDTDFEILGTENIGGEEWVAVVDNGVNRRMLLADFESYIITKNIPDIDEIRQNAAQGATAYHMPNGGIPRAHLSGDVQGSLGKADRAVQPSTLQNALAIKQDKLTFDDYPESGSENPVKSDGIYQAIQDIDKIESISVNGSPRPKDASGNVNIVVPDELKDLADDAEHRLVSDAEKDFWDNKYDFPAGGIPASDLAPGVMPDLSRFITKWVNDLVYYYKKSEVYNKQEVSSLVSGFHPFVPMRAEELPEASADTMYKICLVPSQNPQTLNSYDEYITIDAGEGAEPRYSWELIGNTSISVDGYVTQDDLDAALATKQDVINSANKLSYSLIANAPQEIHIQYNASGVDVAQAVANRNPGSIVYLDYNNHLYPLVEEYGGGTYYYASFGGWDGETTLRMFVVAIASLDNPYETTSWEQSAVTLPSDVEKTAWSNKYDKPSAGIPKTHLAQDVLTSLSKADTALQSFTEADPIFSASAAAGISSSDITNWDAKQDALIVEVGGMERNNVSGGGSITITGIRGQFPTITKAGTYKVSTKMQSSTQSYGLSITFGSNSYTLNTTNGVIEDERELTFAANAAWSGAVVGSVGANTYINISVVGQGAITTLSNVAVSGSYNDLSNLPSIPAAQIQSDWNQTTTTAKDYIKNKPSIPSKTSDLTNDSGFITTSDIPEGSAASTTVPKMDGTAAVGTELAFARGDHRHPSDTSKQDVIDSSHKLPYSLLSGTPTIPDELADLQDDATHRLVTDTEKSTWNAKSDFSGSYNDLTNKPTIPAAQVNSDWNASSGVAQILNKPTIPSNTSDLTNDSGFITIADVPEGSTASTTTPKMDGTAAVGTETAFARGDHIHPSDTSKQDVIGDLADIRAGAALGATALQSYTETDPTVPSWAKASSKPTYTASEVGALPDTTVIPDELADLADDSTHRLVTDTEKTTWNGKQDALVSGTNIKTINSQSLVGSGNIAVGGVMERKTTIPSGGMLPNVYYDLGTVTSYTFIINRTGLDSTIVNHWIWAFRSSDSTDSSIVWPTGLSWDGGSAPTINRGKRYEISVIGYYAEFNEMDISSAE